MPVIRGTIVNAVVTQEPPGATEQVTLLIRATVSNVRAVLDLGTLADEALDTKVRAVAFGAAGALITVAAVGDSPSGVTIDETGNAVTISYEDGVSTVEDVEDEIIASATLIEIDEEGTGATVLAALTDDFAATPLVHTPTVLSVVSTEGTARHDGSGPPSICDDIPGQSIDITVDNDGVVTAIGFTA